MITAIQIVPQAQCETLEHKQRRARKELMRNPLAKAANVKLQLFFRKRLRKSGRDNVVRFPK